MKFLAQNLKTVSTFKRDVLNSRLFTKLTHRGPLAFYIRAHKNIYVHFLVQNSRLIKMKDVA